MNYKIVLSISSKKIGSALLCLIAFPVATNVNACVITSSPAITPKDLREM